MNGYTPPTSFEKETDYARRYIPWAHNMRAKMNKRLGSALALIDNFNWYLECEENDADHAALIDMQECARC